MALTADLISLAFLIFVAYRGFSVILFAPIAAMIPLLLLDPTLIPTVFTGLFMEKVVTFVKLYFALFLLGALFGKLMEVSGFARSIIAGIAALTGEGVAIGTTVIAAAVLTYGGVSLFVVVFAVYPFAAEAFRRADVPKRLIPATMALGGFSFTMDALPGTPQIQNIIPTTFFGTTAWAAPWMGIVGSVTLVASGLAYLEWCIRRARHRGEGYGEGHINEPVVFDHSTAVHPLLAIVPLVVVVILNKLFGAWIPQAFGPEAIAPLPGLPDPLIVKTGTIAGIWSLEAALIVAILLVIVIRFDALRRNFGDASKTAVGGALLAIMNTGSEYGYGGVIAALPGFATLRTALGVIPNPLLNVAIVTTTLAGVTGSASGGMSIALAAMADQFVAMAHAAHVPLEAMHRVAAMASGGMDCLPHNGVVITTLAVTGLTHRQAYKDIFVITLLKTTVVFVAIGFYYLTGLV
jgi:H+/gluconate symporter-like permease